jgi:hypothetical protein
MLSALFCKEKDHPTFFFILVKCIRGGFIAAAGLAAAVYQLWSGIISQSVNVENPALFLGCIFCLGGRWMGRTNSFF